MNIDRRRARLAIASMALLGLIAAGCGDDEADADSPPVETAPSSTEAAATTTAAPSSTDPAASTEATTEATNATTEPAPSTTAAPEVDLSGVKVTVGEVNLGISSVLNAAGLDDTPYEVEFVSADSTSVTLEGVKAGSIDFFSSGEPPAVFGAAADNPFKIVATYYKPVSSNAVIVPEGSDIKTVADLAGKTIASNAGTTAEKVLYRALAEVGLGPDDIELVNLKPAEGFAAFTSGQIDAWATFDPHLIIAEQQYGATVLVDGSNGRHSGVLFLAASDSALEDDGKVAAIADLLDRIRAAQAWARQPENRDAYLALQSELNKQTVEVNGGVYDRGPEEWKPIDEWIVTDTQRTADEFEALGVTPAVDMSQFFDQRFNQPLYGVD